ncbi:HD domain-containing phosphohydrolase [Polynucleobacter aenigmaticus]|nr:HD domain-containing phosphohydrolase [Polynucleobacter aenigmaticus]
MKSLIITNSTLHQKALQQKSIEFQKVLDIIPSMVGYWDKDLLNRFANKAYTSWFGITPEQMFGKHIQFLLGDDLYHSNLPHIEAVLRGEAQTFGRTIPVPDSDEVRYSVAEYIPDIQDGQLQGFYVQVADITMLKRAEDAIKERIEEAHQTEDQMLASLNALSLVRDNETGNHVIRTQHYVKAIATRLFAMGKYPDQINEQKIDLLFRAAPLHDIGKVGIPDSILQNPSKLDDDEWATMKTHTTIGESVLSAANLQYQNKKTIIGTAIKIAGGYHEHWDGSGYPRGLVGEAIPVAARIMAIADVYDALVSKRVYKQQWTHEQAASEIISMRGTKFDPVIVDAFIAEQNNILEIAQQYRDA